MTDYYKDEPSDFVPRKKYTPDPPEIPTILADLERGRQGLSVSTLYDIIEYLIENRKCI